MLSRVHKTMCVVIRVLLLSDKGDNFNLFFEIPSKLFRYFLLSIFMWLMRRLGREICLADGLGNRGSVGHVFLRNYEHDLTSNFFEDVLFWHCVMRKSQVDRSMR